MLTDESCVGVKAHPPEGGRLMYPWRFTTEMATLAEEWDRKLVEIGQRTTHTFFPNRKLLELPKVDFATIPVTLSSSKSSNWKLLCCSHEEFLLLRMIQIPLTFQVNCVLTIPTSADSSSSVHLPNRISEWICPNRNLIPIQEAIMKWNHLILTQSFQSHQL